MADQAAALQAFYRTNQLLGTTERYRTAATAELYHLSLQHEGKADWHDKRVPLRERKPRIVVPLPRKIVEAVDRFVWAGTRAPEVRVGATLEADAAQGAGTDVGPALDADQAEVLTAFLGQLIRHGRLMHAVREYTTKALVTTSAAVVVGVQGGYLNAYVHGGKDCTPTFDAANPRVLAQLEIKYQYPREERQPGGVVREVWYWYRRIITAQRDIVYQEVEVTPREPVWTEDPAKTVDHALGFCPVVWVRTFPDCDDAVDGKPLIDPALHPLFDAISYTVSQKQRAVEYGADPQPWRKGVPLQDRTELAKTPGQIWDLPGDDPVGGKVEVGFLEVKGDGAKTAGEHLKEMQQLLREVVGVVDSTPEMHARQVTGAALEMLYAPMIALASDLRVDLGDMAYCELLGMALRLVTHVVQVRGEAVWVPGVQQATKLLQGAQLQGVWLDPPIVLEWPPFFADTEADRKARVEYTTAAEQGGLITKATATRHVASTFALDDWAAEADEVAEEAAKQSDYGPLAGEQPGAAPGQGGKPATEEGGTAAPPDPEE